MGLGVLLEVLQNFIFPDESRADRTPLYVDEWFGGPTLAQDGTLKFEAGEGASFCSFFNVFSHRKWREITGLDGLALRVNGSGKVKIAIRAYTFSAAAWEIVSKDVDLGDEPGEIDVPEFSKLTGEVLAVALTALEGGAKISAMAWVTPNEPRRMVALCGVITTFRREEAVTKAIRTFAEVTCANPPVGSVKLFVIDNGQTLTIEPPAGITIFSNPNLGGAGGFARGLLEATDAAEFTHVLFMDDDASCEPESVWRTLALLSYAQDAKTSVAGAMLLSNRPTIQHEKGAIFDTSGRQPWIWSALNHNRDLADFGMVCSNDGADRANYGAWWFFAYPLASVKYMPFPFFVRGDDVDFSLMNDFHIVTLNGVATWCDDFGLKHSPSTEYLANRSWLALSLMHCPNAGRMKAFKQTAKLVKRLGLRFDYASMYAVLDAVMDVLKGPEFFKNTPAPLEQLDRVKSRKNSTATTRDEFDHLTLRRPLQRHGLMKKLTMRLWGWHPSFRNTDCGTVVHRRIPWDFSRGSLKGVTLTISGSGMNLETTTMNRHAFFDGMRRLARIGYRIKAKLKQAGRKYRSEGPGIRSEEYWRKQLKLPEPGSARMSLIRDRQKL